MYCKNCGKEVLPGAVVCLNCGFEPLSERNYCQNCGAKTEPKQIVCIKCGNSLEVKGHSSKADYNGFYRSKDEKIFAGVCGGLAHKTGASVVMWRIIVFLLCLFWIPFLAYLAMAIFAPSLPTKGVEIK